MQEFKKSLQAWNKRSDVFTKQQAGYVVLAVVLFLLAGIVSLINYNLGQTILFFAFIAGLTFIANGVMTAIIRTFVVPGLEAPATKSRKK
jgi:cell division protein FtsW (lipid II flippase)